ncbi:hypothetical protein SAMN02745671_01175 [Anaerovibrio lipolyticus DSM 3074]|uniref:Phage virion morphogenesis family protein n=1 Tax=Anaerovibrio lipolyticus DSM 3074 TaxID=1120997 RepID=A0A1M6CMF3_9FIRM|nr:hypothetical protein [Anaerovibrio lipolyticus]SHI61964.1 hypothetical protein SAMN02745671_01175 [Anaerovibrio lipolyticus DSM 3074]
MAVNVSITEKGVSLQDLKRFTERLSDKELAAGVLRTAGKEKKTGADLVDVATWNEYGTKNIPKRPFMRKAASKNGKKWGELSEAVAERVIDGMGVEQAVEVLGNQMVGDIQNVIGDRTLLRANAPSTIRQKGSDAPLIDTGLLRGSIDFEVR